jgi:thioredoxin-like negative regulator of GroEL
MFKGHRPEIQATTTELAGNSAGALEEGKEFLREGNVASAINSLRIARLDRATFGEASNALAIAYIRLGRNDLADRYFREAIQAEPENDKFAANLLRLQSQVMLARASAAAPAVPAAAMPAPAVAAATPAARQPTQDRLASGMVERVSRSEVQVRSRPDLGAAPTAVVAFRNTPVDSDKSPQAKTQPSYPIRFRLPE